MSFACEANVPPPLEAADDLANEATLDGRSVCYCIGVLYASFSYLDTVRLDSDEAVNPVSLVPLEDEALEHLRLLSRHFGMIWFCCLGSEEGLLSPIRPRRRKISDGRC